MTLQSYLLGVALAAYQPLLLWLVFQAEAWRLRRRRGVPARTTAPDRSAALADKAGDAARS